MARLIVPCISVLLLFGSAVATAQKGGGPGKTISFRGEGDGSPGRWTPDGAPDSILTIDLTGLESWDGFGSPNNEILREVLGSSAEVTGVGWDLTIETVAPTSWLHEAVAAFYSNDVNGFGFDVAPGVGDFFSGMATYSSGGILYLSDFDIPNLPIGDDGLLFVQLWESFDDIENAVDARYPRGRYEVAFIGGTPVNTLPTIGFALLGLLMLAAGAWILARKIPG